MRLLEKEIEIWDSIVTQGDTEDNKGLFTEWEEIEESRRAELQKLSKHVSTYEQILGSDQGSHFIYYTPSITKKDFSKRKNLEEKQLKDRNFSLLFKKPTNCPMSSSIYNLYYNPTV